mgnify:CR=1 FL=1
MHLEKIVKFFLCFALIFASCGKNNFERTGDGLLYRFIERKNGRNARVGELMKMHLRYRDAKGKELYDSGELGNDFIVQLSLPTFIGGLEEGFSMMGEGDSAVFSVPADSVFEKTFHQTLPPSVNKGDFLTFEVRLFKVLTAEEYRKEKGNVKVTVSVEEQGAIESYLIENDLRVEPSRPGVYYIELKTGSGTTPVHGDSVEIRYTGRFLNGEVFDGSEKAGENLRYRLGDGMHLPAWEDAVSTMKVGGISRLILSSENAFGKKGFGPVPPSTTVIYDIELINVIKGAI